jgi:methylenetetrahydrofolate dehydrogenase (NADP+)/methenyltetrahydrofolate cyclohydrolase
MSETRPHEAGLIDGRAIAALLRRQVAVAVAELQSRAGVKPGLAAIVIGDDPASQVYVRNKVRACGEAGIASFEHHLAADCKIASALDLVAQLNADDRVDGILVQLPLPEALDAATIVAAVDPAKDVDGFHPLNVGRLWRGEPGLVPCTPQGVMRLLRGANRPLAGAEAVVVGRSQIVGRPLAALLLAADCTVTVVHSRTRDPAALCRRADILIAAVGRPGFVGADWVKPGATVIDVGISRIALPEGGTRLAGDVDFAAVRRLAGLITPVPGGVGPMTIACLLLNTLVAACRRRGLAEPMLPGS